MSLSFLRSPVHLRLGQQIRATAVCGSPDSQASRYLGSSNRFHSIAPTMKDSPDFASNLANLYPGLGMKIDLRLSSTFWRLPPVPNSENEDEKRPVEVPAMLYEVLSRPSLSISVLSILIFEN